MRGDRPYSLKPLRQRVSAGVSYAFSSAQRSLGPCGEPLHRLGALATRVGEVSGLARISGGPESGPARPDAAAWFDAGFRSKEGNTAPRVARRCSIRPARGSADDFGWTVGDPRLPDDPGDERLAAEGHEVHSLAQRFEPGDGSGRD